MQRIEDGRRLGRNLLVQPFSSGDATQYMSKEKHPKRASPETASTASITNGAPASSHRPSSNPPGERT
jgi:hypothetical protein